MASIPRGPLVFKGAYDASKNGWSMYALAHTLERVSKTVKFGGGEVYVFQPLKL